MGPKACCLGPASTWSVVFLARVEGIFIISFFFSLFFCWRVKKLDEKWLDMQGNLCNSTLSGVKCGVAASVPSDSCFVVLVLGPHPVVHRADSWL